MDEDKYQNKYRVQSARLTGWDYGSHGLYFVTICTKDRIPYFGDIKEQEGNIISLHKTQIGKVAFNNWLQIPNRITFAELDEFVIMPNHIHGIIFLNKPNKLSWEINKFGPQRDNLASVIRGYKSSVKSYANLNNIDFDWQPKYYDRIIRNEEEYHNIRGYIYDNPNNWLLNKDNLENIFTL
jgi:REP element-mobilizing transposase RayT